MRVELRRVYGQITEAKIYKDLQDDVLTFQRNVQEMSHIDQFKIVSLSYLISYSSIVYSHSITCANQSMYLTFKEKSQLRKDAGPGIRNSFERTTALDFRDQSGRSGTDKFELSVRQRVKRV